MSRFLDKLDLVRGKNSSDYENYDISSYSRAYETTHSQLSEADRVKINRCKENSE